MGKARLVIKEGIKSKDTGIMLLMDPENEDLIKARIEEAIINILRDTEYEKTKGNPPTFGVEKDTV